MSPLDAEKGKPNKKAKHEAEFAMKPIYFHPEDKVLIFNALVKGSFDYDNVEDDGASDAKRAFSDKGIKTQGCLMLFEAERFKEAVDEISDEFRARTS